MEVDEWERRARHSASFLVHERFNQLCGIVLALNTSDSEMLHTTLCDWDTAGR